MNGFVHDCIGVGLGMALGVFIGVGIANAMYYGPKKECEAELPRNVECVWRAP